jgi:hypothetical protein
VTYYPVTAVYAQDISTNNLTVSPTEGIAAMGGGSVSVSAGGDFSCQVGAFGQGNLQVYSGGNVTGLFFVKDGTGAVSAMGNFGAPAHPQLVEMGASQVSVSAQGSVYIAAVNPNLSEAGSQGYWDNGYTQSSSVSVTAVTEDANIYGVVDPNSYGQLADEGYFPATVHISAGRDIIVSNDIVQLPAQYGNLTMQAGRDIVFNTNASWYMSDADLSSIYPGYPSLSSPDLSSHASTPVHTGDNTPVSISAVGDITDMDITLPKAATITAGGDIESLSFTGQNVGPFDATSIIANGDIVYTYGENGGVNSIQVGGPGYLVVQAGGTIDLGTSSGIRTIGNGINPAALSAGETGASLIVAAGVASPLNSQTETVFFDAIQTAGQEYSTLQASGNPAGAAAVVSQLRASTIDPFLASANNGQDINMTSSQISTVGGGSVFILATGNVNVGTTLLSVGASTGILTETGGAINIFTVGDLNVNQSRVMTFQGGDIAVWSDQGSINAGKGSKAAVSASAPTFSLVNGVWTEIFNPPAVGSGIRALTYQSNPNTPAPPEGNIYLFAPSGIIDAGEAGISGAKVYLGATTVLNASNVSSTAGSVGLPPASQGVSLGALSGTSDMSKSTVSSDTGALATSQERVASAQPIEDMVVKWIDVKVMSYDLTFGGDDASEEKDDILKKK